MGKHKSAGQKLQRLGFAIGDASLWLGKLWGCKIAEGRSVLQCRNLLESSLLCSHETSLMAKLSEAFINNALK